MASGRPRSAILHDPLAMAVQTVASLTAASAFVLFGVPANAKRWVVNGGIQGAGPSVAYLEDWAMRHSRAGVSGTSLVIQREIYKKKQPGLGTDSLRAQVRRAGYAMVDERDAVSLVQGRKRHK